MKALITGSSGFVGHHLATLLLKEGFDVRGVDKRECGIQDPRFEFCQADLTVPTSLSGVVEDCELVFHTAAIFDYRASSALTFATNVGGTRNLLEEIRKSDSVVVRLVNWSSAIIYGDLEYVPADEKHPIRPKYAYDRSKWEQEKLAHEIGTDIGIEVVSLRPTAIYGPRSFYGDALALFAIKDGKALAIPGSGKALGHHVHVLDVTRAALLLATTSHNVAGEAFNVADDTPLSVEDSLVGIAKMMNVRPPRFHLPRPAIALFGYADRAICRLQKKRSAFEKPLIDLLFSDHVYDIRKLSNLGFDLQRPSFLEGAVETIEWYRREGLL